MKGFGALPLIVASIVIVSTVAVDEGDDDNPPWKKSRELLSSVVIMRHGDRAAQRTAPAYAAGDRETYNAKFPIDNGEWPVDYGQLTKRGARQTRDFGSYLRDRYVGKRKMLAREYNHFETHARSTDVDRTLVSAMAAMAGLYPGDSLRNGIEGTVLVPVHTVPYKTDSLMDGSSANNCPKFGAASTELLDSDKIRDMIVGDTELFNAFPALAGVSMEDLKEMKGTMLVKLVTSLRDLRLCQRAHNMYQPPNVTRYDSHLERLTGAILEAKWSIPGMGPLVGGKLLRAIANRMEAIVAVHEHQPWALKKLAEECNAKGEDSDEDGGCPRKLALYTGHDTTIFDVRAALGVNITVPGVVPYVSHLIFELDKGERHDDYQVTLLAGSYLENAKPLAGPFCRGESSCDLRTFLQYVHSTVPENIDAACALRAPMSRAVAVETTSPKPQTALRSVIMFSLFCAAGTLLVALIVSFTLRMTGLSRSQYTKIN